jgi:hypothetical protein
MTQIRWIRVFVLVLACFQLSPAQSKTISGTDLAAQLRQPEPGRIVSHNSRLDLSFQETGRPGMLEISGTLTYRSNKSIIIDQNNGLHVMRGGEVHIHAGESVFIGPGLTVEQGASFSVGVDPKVPPMDHNVYQTFAPELNTTPLPTEYALQDNYPNPFNPSTTIRYALPMSGQVSLKLYNVLGQEVKVLVDEEQGAGYKTINFSSGDLPSGIYIYKLVAGSFLSIKRMMLVK